MVIKRWLINILLSFLVNFSVAQKIAFKNYTVSQGLSSSELYSLCQDSKGFIWYCSDAGICKYDGYSFKTYTSEQGLPDNTIFKIYEDRSGKMWFVGMSKKVSYYDPLTDSIYGLACNDEIVRLMKNSVVSSLYIDTTGVLYIGPNSGKFFLKVFPYKNYSVVLPLKFKNEGWQFYFINNNDMIWGVTSEQDKKDNLKINTHYTKNKKTEHKEYLYPTYYSNRFRYAAQVPKGIFFTEDNTLYYKTSDTLIRKIIDPVSPIISLNYDKNGDLWCGLMNKGVVKFKHADIFSTPERYLNQLSVTGVLQDKEGGYWFSTLEHGVYYVPSFVFTYYDKSVGLSGNKIYSLASHLNTIYCFAEDKSLNIIQDSIIKINKTVVGVRCYELGKDQDELFVAGDASFFYNVKTHRKRYIKHGFPTKNYFVRKAFFSADGNIYAINTVGISRINNKTAEPKIIIKEHAHITSVYSEGNNIWFGSSEGLFKLDHDKTEKLSSRHRLLKNRVDDIIEDSNRNLWFATKGAGIIIKNGNKIKQLSTKNGLSSNLCKTLLYDSLNTVWVGTNRGISKIKILGEDQYEIENYSNIHGLLSDEINQIIRQGNYIYAATNQGVIRFDKNLLYSNHTPPPIYISAFFVNDKEITLKNKHDLLYKENFIKINVLGLSYKNPGNITYQYRLVGLDSTWNYTKNTTIQYTTLPPGNYHFQVYAINHDGVRSTDMRVISFNIKKPFWKTWWFILLLSILIILIFYLFYYYRIKSIQLQEEEKTRLNKKIAEVELKAIRAQMNPHFIFNSINSIQHYILTENADMAYRYLSKFSRLIRNVLENSKHELIPLNKEIETIELYVELEKLRFETKFSHTVYIAPTLDALTLSISPLLIQPYVENAIWHGLMHKKTPGHLSVSFIDEGDLIKCIIQDNGIGRKMAEAVKKNNFKKHKSLALSLNNERLEIISNLFNNQFKITIYDIELEDGTPDGTRVELIIPKIKYTEHDNSYYS